MELLLPIILFGMLIGIRYALKPTKEDPTSYYDSKYAFFASPNTSVSWIDGFTYSDFGTGCVNTPDQLLQIGIVGDHPVTQRYADYMNSKHFTRSIKPTHFLPIM